MNELDKESERYKNLENILNKYIKETFSDICEIRGNNIKNYKQKVQK